MALQTFDFSKTQLHAPDYEGLRNLIPNVAAGYKMSRLPAEQAEAEKKARLENALKEVEYKYAEPNAIQSLATGNEDLESKRLANALSRKYGVSEKEADILVKQAQAKHYQDQAAGRTFAPSALGKLIQERNDLAAKDPNDPLLAEYDRVIKAQGGGKGYAPSALGKLASELQQVEEGFLPGSNGQVPLNAVEQEELRNKYKLMMQKATTDSGTRTTVLRGQNLLKSIDASNIDALTRYSGPKGAAKLKYEQGKDLVGKPSEEYLQHLEALQAVQLEAKELRQFFGDSITPEAANAIYEMVNATSLTRSPEAAKRMIEKSRATIKKQIKTFEDALNNPNAYSSGTPQVPTDFAGTIKNAQNPPKLFGNLQLEDDGSQ